MQTACPKLSALAVLVALFTACPLPAEAAGQPASPTWQSVQPVQDDYTSSQGKDVAIDHEGNILVTGFIERPDGNYDIVTLKYSPDGELLWSSVYDYSWYDVGTAVTSDSGGNVIVAGASYDPDNPIDIYLKTYYTDYVVLKYSPQGSLLFDVTASGAGKNCVPSAACTDPDGGIYVTGKARDATGSHDAYYTVKFDGAGRTLWEQIEDWGADAGAVGIGVVPAGVIVTGYALDTSRGNYDIKTVLYSRDGYQKEASTYRTPNQTFDEFAASLAVDESGGAYITGRSSDVSGVTLTLKLDEDLKPVWADPLFFYERENHGSAVSMDEHGRTFVLGSLSRGDGSTVPLLLVYGPQGELLDRLELNELSGFVAAGIALEPDGDMLVTGANEANNAPDSMSTIRLAGYPSDAAASFDLESAIKSGRRLTLAEPPMRMLRTVLLSRMTTLFYGCLPATVFVADPIGPPGDYEYRFLVTRGDGLVWEKVRDYSPLGFWVLKPLVGKDPVTGVMVQVRGKGSTMDYQAMEYIYLDIQ